MIQSRWEMADFGIIWINFLMSIFTYQQKAQSDEINTSLKSVPQTDLILKEMDKNERKNIYPTNWNLIYFKGNFDLSNENN